MIDQKLINAVDARKALKTVFDAIPKGKVGMGTPVFTAMICVEGTLNAAFQQLANMRKYFLDTTGEESPFVKKIDELLPRS